LNNVGRRKAEHLDILRNEITQYQHRKSGFEQYELIPNTVSSLSWDAIETETFFMGKKLKFPLMISSMSGGTGRSKELNRVLARSAKTWGLALGMGSLRPLLQSRGAIDSYAVIRQEAPDIPLLGNIGFAQIASGEWRNGLFDLLSELGCDALIIHFNKIQEYVQIDGDRVYKSLERELADLFCQSPFPLIAKEVGHGFSQFDLTKLFDWGFRFIDVAGAGGTSWVRVEAARNPEMLIAANSILEMGIETAESLRLLQHFPKVYAIASGGIRSGEEIAMALAFGARLAAAAAPFYLIWEAEGESGLSRLIAKWYEELKRTLYFAGISNIHQLWHQPERIRRSYVKL